VRLLVELGIYVVAEVSFKHPVSVSRVARKALGRHVAGLAEREVDDAPSRSLRPRAALPCEWLKTLTPPAPGA
jgi:hypothetical protein